MDHGYFKDRISAYFDNSLRPEEKVIIEQHLQECEECRKLLEAFHKLDRLVEEKSYLGKDEYWERSARKIEEKLGFKQATEVTKIASPRRFGMALKLVAVAASVVLLTVVGIHRDEIWKEEPVQRPATIPAGTPPAVTEEAVGENEITKQEIPAGSLSTSEQSTVKKPPKVPTRSVEAIKETTDYKTDELQQPLQMAMPEAAVKGVADSEKQVQKSKGEHKVSLPEGQGDRDKESLRVAGEPYNLYEEKAQARPTESLVSLRIQKDSLLKQMDSKTSWRDKAGLVQSLSGKSLKDKDKVERKPADIENDLIQTCYKIALLTEDDREREEMLAIIRKTALDNDSPNQEMAKSYLQQLDLQK
ncbi:MAG: zf-HC2 domain-containing protein [candidate division Zixibacteria bacterium]|nr:zf-HC2 domain-containing protein [candidate division Zixibacteria bacterium]MDD5426549.1 zf-HC2 domain-containing protein [candidate division Zixibacteria bacterium]